jgi:hypothetical protein
MEERDLGSIIEREVAGAIGQWTGELADDRATELDYYNSEPFGNEVEGESQVVSSDVFDTVEGMLPSLLKIFTASDDVVYFEPNGPEDEEQAAQRTEVCNYVFYRQNNGFLILYEWFKDALIQKNGIVKYWWDENESRTEEEYQGLSEGQYIKLVSGKDVEVLEHSEYPDDAEIELRQTKLQAALANLEKQPLPPEQKAMMAQQIQQQLTAQPIPPLHDVKIRIVKDQSKICIEAIPPEEFGISQRHKCVSIQDTPFCYHRTKKTISMLREMGCPEDIIEQIGSGDQDMIDISPEVLARDRILDQKLSFGDPPDPSMREVVVTDAYIRIDWDGDGIAELRHVIKAGDAIWVNEECSHIPFAAITPIIMPHRWLGKSAAELVMADQFTKSVIWRQILNNLYLTNNPRKAVLSTASGVVQANLDDLMNNRAGGIMREYVQGAIRNEETPFVAGQSFPMLEYIDQQKEVRTGQSRYNQGTDADSLNKTARGIQMIQQAGQQRGDLIARIFAETGVKDLMRGISYMLSKYSTKAMTLRLRNKWVEVDPREWKTQFDMTINVGLGTGNKDVQLAHLSAMGEKQGQLMEMGKGYLVTDQNIYNLYKKMAEAMGFKHPEIFVSDPSSVQQPPPQPNPEMIKIQAEKDTDEKKIQSAQQTRVFDAQTQKEIESIKRETAVMLAQITADSNERLARAQMEHDARMKVFESNKPQDNSKLALEEQLTVMQAQMNSALEQERIASQERQAATQRQFDEWKATLEAQTKLEIAKIGSETSLRLAAESAKMSKSTEPKEKQESKSESPEIHVHLPSGKKTITSPSGEKYQVEDVD